MTRIALDAMGGDFAPKQIVVGAVEAACGIPDVEILLVGQMAAIQSEIESFSKDRRLLAQRAIESGTLKIIHAPEILEMDDTPAESVRKKKDCSINVAMRLVKEGRADVFVSAGNSGAVAASAMFTLKRIAQVHRPAIAMILPTATPDRPLLLLDAGANMDCKPEWLAQWAVMGSVFSRSVLGRENPAVGLVSIGAEPCKGNALVHETYPQIAAVKGLNFVGNIEGHDICGGNVDVAVADGFVGNVILKSVESVAHAIGGWLKAELKKNFFRMLCALTLKGAFKALKRQMDPEVYGGAPLLGVNGNVIITHGNSTHKAIFYAVKAGVAAATNDVSGLIAKAVAEHAASANTQQ